MERLLVEFGDREDVELAIQRNLETLGWVGSEAAQYAPFEMPLKALYTHRVPHVRDWSVRILKYLSDRKREAMNYDEEREAQAELSQ